MASHKARVPPSNHPEPTAAKRARLCPIYAQDVISLLSRKKVEKLRRVSQGMQDAMVGMWPSKLPRRQCPVLEMLVVGSFMVPFINSP